MLQRAPEFERTHASFETLAERLLRTRLAGVAAYFRNA
jgi:hypothetical protein